MLKKILSILGIIIIITTGVSNLIACDHNILTSEKLAKLKKQNKITINDNNLKWITSQEKPFYTIDNKYF